LDDDQACEDLQDQLDELKFKLSSLQRQLDSSRIQQSSECSELLELRRLRDDCVKSHGDRLSEMESANQDLVMALNESKQHHDRVVAEMDLQRQECERSLIAEHAAQLHKLKQENQTSDASYAAKFQKQCDEISSLKQELELKCSEHESRILELSLIHSNSLQESESSRNRLQSRLEELQGQLESAYETRDRMTLEWEQTLKDVQLKQRMVVKQLQSENNQLKQQYQDLLQQVQLRVDCSASSIQSPTANSLNASSSTSEVGVNTDHSGHILKASSDFGELVSATQSGSSSLNSFMVSPPPSLSSSSTQTDVNHFSIDVSTSSSTSVPPSTVASSSTPMSVSLLTRAHQECRQLKDSNHRYSYHRLKSRCELVFFGI
jgi:hypothetical protein